MEEKQIGDELASIRNLMERSSKFISLSGLSGILAGVYALVGAALAYSLVYKGEARIYTTPNLHTYPQTIYYLIIIALCILMLSIATGYILTIRKAKR